MGVIEIIGAVAIALLALFLMNIMAFKAVKETQCKPQPRDSKGRFVKRTD